MHAKLRLLALLLLATLVVAACTRDRSTPEPTAVADLPAETVRATPAPLEPEVVEEATSTPEAEEEGEEAEPSETGTPEADDLPETFQYAVRPGETLLSIAIKFGTDVETIRELNFIIDDAIAAGQPIKVPYVEGISAEGMPTPTPGPFIYTVQPGDTLGSIGVQFGIDSVTIVEANELDNPDSLSVGDEIIIPGLNAPSASGSDDGEGASDSGGQASTGGELVIHVVQPGESLLQIGETYGVTAAEIAAYNNLANRNLLRAGQELVIPGVTQQEALAARGVTHVVRSGEGLLGIAAQYGVTIDEIVAANGLASADEINVGQELIIPTE